jgi:hypothetical protein
MIKNMSVLLAILLGLALFGVAAYPRYVVDESGYEQSQADTMDTLVSVDSPLGLVEVLITPNAIHIQPFEVANDNQVASYTITQEEHPLLFEQGVANVSFVSARLEEDSPTQLVLSNNQPDHGAYSPTYQVVVNLATGEITE